MAAGDDDGDEDYNSKGEKWSKEMLPCVSSRPDFMILFLESMQVLVPRPPHVPPPHPAPPHRAALLLRIWDDTRIYWNLLCA